MARLVRTPRATYRCSIDSETGAVALGQRVSPDRQVVGSIQSLRVSTDMNLLWDAPAHNFVRT